MIGRQGSNLRSKISSAKKHMYFPDGPDVDTMRSLFYESGYTTAYLRIVRVCYTKQFASSNYPKPKKLEAVTYRLYLWPNCRSWPQ